MLRHTVYSARRRMLPQAETAVHGAALFSLCENRALVYLLNLSGIRPADLSTLTFDLSVSRMVSGLHVNTRSVFSPVLSYICLLFWAAAHMYRNTGEREPREFIYQVHNIDNTHKLLQWPTAAEAI